MVVGRTEHVLLTGGKLEEFHESRVRVSESTNDPIWSPEFFRVISRARCRGRQMTQGPNRSADSRTWRSCPSPDCATFSIYLHTLPRQIIALQMKSGSGRVYGVPIKAHSARNIHGQFLESHASEFANAFTDAIFACVWHQDKNEVITQDEKCCLCV